MELEQAQSAAMLTINSAGDNNNTYHEGGSALNLIIAKLQQLLSDEKNQLSAGDLSTLPAVAAQKIQLFAQLSKYSQTGQLLNLDEGTVAKIKGVKSLLAENAKLLKLRMDAISEISDTISAAMTEADSDSTYSVWSGL